MAHHNNAITFPRVDWLVFCELINREFSFSSSAFQRRAELEDGFTAKYYCGHRELRCFQVVAVL
jgi:hypothetical protein